MGEWPWQVSLRDKPQQKVSQHFCGAVLIDSETVLTAAHCVWDCDWDEDEQKCQKSEGRFTHERFIVALGFHKSSVTIKEKDQIINRDRKYGTQIQQIDTREGKLKGKVIVHPDYKGSSYYGNWLEKTAKSGWMPNDIAIIQLRTQIIFSKNSDSNLFRNNDKVKKRNERIGTYVRPICLPKPDGGIKPESQNKIWITGYGKIEKDRNAMVLREGETNLIANKQCTSKLRNSWKASENILYHITETQVCALSKKKPVDACQGDSGGPMSMSVTSEMIMKNDEKNDKIKSPSQKKKLRMYNQYERYQLEGLTSWGFNCGGKVPGVYTKVSQFMEFILEHSKHVQTVENEMLSI